MAASLLNAGAIEHFLPVSLLKMSSIRENFKDFNSTFKEQQIFRALAVRYFHLVGFSMSKK